MQKYLAELNTGRHGHACSKYVNEDSETVSLIKNITMSQHGHLKILLVTGGKEQSMAYISSTEIYMQSTWSYRASLPSPRAFFPSATVGNFVFVFGIEAFNHNI